MTLDVRVLCYLNAARCHQVNHPSYVSKSSHVEHGVVRMDDRVFGFLGSIVG